MFVGPNTDALASSDNMHLAYLFKRTLLSQVSCLAVNSLAQTLHPRSFIPAAGLTLPYFRHLMPSAAARYPLFQLMRHSGEMFAIILLDYLFIYLYLLFTNHGETFFLPSESSSQDEWLR